MKEYQEGLATRDKWGILEGLAPVDLRVTKERMDYLDSLVEKVGLVEMESKER